MIEFKPVRLEDRAVIERYTMPSGICNCDLAFANMYCWQAVFHSAWAEIGGFLVIRFQIDGGERIGYMQPVGEGDFGPILPLLREDAHAHGQRLRIIGLKAATRSAGSFPAISRSSRTARWRITSTTPTIFATLPDAAISPSATTSTASRPNIPTTATKS